MSLHSWDNFTADLIVRLALRYCIVNGILEGPDSQALNCSLLQSVNERLETVKENMNLLVM